MLVLLFFLSITYLNAQVKLNYTIEQAWYRMNEMYSQETDMNLFGITDYWQSPPVFYLNGVGDCEDFAIAIMLLTGDDKVTLQAVRLTFYPDRWHMIVKLTKFLWLDPTAPGRYLTKANVLEYGYTYTYHEVLDILQNAPIRIR